MNKTPLPRKTAALFGLAVLTLNSCVSPPPKIDLTRNGISKIEPKSTSKIPDLYLRERAVLRNGKAPKIGLALSGGGIRSSLFSIGAMKGIFDHDNGKLFSQIDAISSVSGGGYASYWLYLNEMAAVEKQLPFSRATFADQAYENHLKKISYRSQMFPWYRFIPHVFLPRPITISRYETRIDYTFGQGNPHDRKVTFEDLRNFVSQNKAPYPIFNTTICSKPRQGDHPKGPQHPTRIMEFTTTHVGNPEFRQVQPFEQFKDHSVSNTVATSGAAFSWFLYQNYPNWMEEGCRKWPLSDGGHNGNLGVTSLVRRGVDKIIVLDGEHSKDYEFEAYRDLQRNLKAIGMKASITDLEDAMKAGHNDRDNPMPKAVFKGTISPIDANHGLQKTIDIVYIRMAFSDDVLDKEEWQTPGSEYRTLQKRGWNKAFCDDRLHELHDPKMCLVTIRSYSDYLRRSVWKNLGHVVGAVHYSFPQMSTFDQGMGHPDKMASLLSLGYLQGLQSGKLLRELK